MQLKIFWSSKAYFVCVTARWW